MQFSCTECITHDQVQTFAFAAERKLIELTKQYIFPDRKLIVPLNEIVPRMDGLFDDNDFEGCDPDKITFSIIFDADDSMIVVLADYPFKTTEGLKASATVYKGKAMT